MENPETKSKLKQKQKQKQSIPPRRGNVKIKILKGLFNSIASIADGLLRKYTKNRIRFILSIWVYIRSPILLLIIT